MLEILVSYLNNENIDGFFVSRPENVRYISNYTGEDSYLFITNKENYFITDARYTEQAEKECTGFVIINWKEVGSSLVDAIQSIVDRLTINSYLFESDFVSFTTYNNLKTKVKAEAIPRTNVIEEFRSIKTPQEIKYLRAACEISDRAFTRIIKDVRVGITEKELASKLSHYMVMEGSDTKPYGNILISGKKTSLLHGIPSNKTVEYGDFVLMDYGCAFNGYLSDMTRTVVVGKASSDQKQVYGLVRQMIEDASSVMLAETKATDVYEASIKAIEDSDYFKYHYSGIGHGIGLYVHELPFMGPKSTAVLKENNVITIEPGIYIPNWGGVRIEDQILITKDSNERLTNSTRELIEL